jgi:hypothetical protein
MKPLQPLQLSAVITFGFVGTLALSAGLWLKDRARLVNEIERLHWQMSYPVHPNGQPRDINRDIQIVERSSGAGFQPARAG